MSALIIDIILWASVAAVGFIAWQRGRLILTTAVREGSMDFINIVPRIALGVIGSGYIAAVIPQEVITGWLGPRPAPGHRLCDRVGAVCVPAAVAVGDSVHAGAFCLVSGRRVAAIPVSGGSHRNGNRQAVRARWTGCKAS